MLGCRQDKEKAKRVGKLQGFAGAHVATQYGSQTARGQQRQGREAGAVGKGGKGGRGIRVFERWLT